MKNIKENKKCSLTIGLKEDWSIYYFQADGLTQKLLKKLNKSLIFLNLKCCHNLPKRNLNFLYDARIWNKGSVTICQRGI